MNKKYKKYRRIYPYIRLSYSLYQKRGNMNDVMNYLKGEIGFVNKYMIRGSELHEQKAITGIDKEYYPKTNEKPILEEKYTLNISEDIEIVIIPDVIYGNTVGDYKCGKLNRSYKHQLQFYAEILNKKGFNITKGLLLKLEGDLSISEKKMFNIQTPYMLDRVVEFGKNVKFYLDNI